MIALLAILFGACKEIPVDSSTANVIRRARDTVVNHDIQIVRDTTIRVDTTVTVNHDTLFSRDTIISTTTIIKTDTVFSRDTVIQKDTIRLRDTITHRDTLKLHGDTVHDTLTKRDTIIQVDTVRQVSIELERSGTLFRKHDGTIPPDSVHVDIDDLTRLTVDLQGKFVTAIQLKFLARITKEYDTARWGVPPSWIYMIVNRLELVGGAGRKTLVADPWNNPTQAGLAIVPRAPYSRQWIAIGAPGSEANFYVSSVDSDTRTIYAYMKARFVENGATIDSLSLKFKY